MSAFDSNRDGYINRLEANDQREFQSGDQNRDGALNFQEFARVDNPAQFGQYDTNRDGLIDAPEYARGEAAEHRYGF